MCVTLPSEQVEGREGEVCIGWHDTPLHPRVRICGRIGTQRRCGGSWPVVTERTGAPEPAVSRSAISFLARVSRLKLSP